ncbi:GntR family transcriptional regulator [Telmatospirillum sp.]|uniref:GntR family transcriptional regulator n=1 Tax=Telmatospirillum sp. TaxID=2079197 RepID=UPI00283C873F|nr:GntR family transcriptional regulator [Telmatospirillum sp.]MDR3438360.1 GntR family transcriptional regulator [Telmatospirillum sp.]
MKETRYAQVARDISEGISSGQFPVGSQLPTEAMLCQRYGASRHTVRSAMRELQEMGLVSRNKKAGTRVEATPASIGYRISLASIDDLSQFGANHVRVVRQVQPFVTDRTQAEIFGCPVGVRWLRISSVRLSSHSNDLPIGWTDVYVEEIYPDLADVVRRQPERLVSSLIEMNYGLCVAEVRQTIEATVVPAHLTDELRVPPGSPALKIIRHYFDVTGKSFETSITIHPADRFVFSMRLTRERAGVQ